MVYKPNNWDELLQDIEDLNREIGNIVYVLIMDDMMLGSTRKSDINEHLAMNKGIVPEIISSKSLDRREVIESLELIHGVLLNPLELPMELPRGFEYYDIWLIRADKSIKLPGAIEYEMYDDLKEVIDDIESFLEEDHSIQIEDFAIIIGNSVDLIIQADTETKTMAALREIV